MSTLSEYAQQLRELAVGTGTSRLLDAAMVHLLEEMAAEIQRLSLAVADREAPAGPAAVATVDQVPERRTRRAVLAAARGAGERVG